MPLDFNDSDGKVGASKGVRSLQRKAAPGTGSYTWMGRIWEFMNHKGFNK